jgi:electron transfer flavoprotein alpha subunit
VGPEIAALLDMPFVASAREVKVLKDEVFAKSERDDGWCLVRAKLPAVLSAAERSSAPARADVAARAAVSPGRIRRVTAEALGPGPWGQLGSPTRVGEVRMLETGRRRMRLTGSLVEQVTEAVGLLSNVQAPPPEATRVEAGAWERSERRHDAPPIAVILEPARGRSARELCGTAARLATHLNATAVGLVAEGNCDWPLGSWGLDHAVEIRGARVEEDVAKAVVKWIEGHSPKVILAPGSLWGREVAARVAASLGLGLIGDAVDIDVSQGEISAWKPAFGGRLLARITARSDPQLITLRGGSAPAWSARTRDVTSSSVEVRPTDRIKILKRSHEDDAEVLFSSRTVVGVGMGVSHADYHLLDPLLELLGATLGCTRKVADRGWLPRTRQIGLTGQHIAPQLYVAIGLRGNSNHVVGIRRAGVVVAINSDPDAPIFDEADIGIVGDWRDAVALLTTRLAPPQREPMMNESASPATTDRFAEVGDRTPGARSCRKLDELDAPTH